LRARELRNQALKGADFVAIARKYPVEGFGNTIAKNDANIPKDIRDAAFALKPGQITEPLPVQGGALLLRLERVESKSLDEVRGDVNQRAIMERFQVWLEAVRKTVSVEN
jgi:parvulin-like peptidyl-prolyl isomerase